MYSSVQDVRLALTIGAVDTIETAAKFEDEQLEDAIRQADGIVDLYVRPNYEIPQDPAPPGSWPEATPPDSVAVAPARYWSRDIAAWLATLTFSKSRDIDKDDPVRLRFNLTLEQLKAVANGELTPLLPVPDDTASGAFVYNLYNGKMFTPWDFGITRWTFVAPHRYGDLAWSPGLDEILILNVGETVPPGTPDGTLIVFVGS